MVYAVVIYPNAHNNSKIRAFRKKYDPQFRLIQPHITLVFPFPDESREKLKDHVSQAAGACGAFELRLNGTKKTPDNYLFLTTKEGTKEIIKLHDKLYTGLLEKHLRKDIPFIPHISLGRFKNSTGCKKAEYEAKLLNLNVVCKITAVHLVHIKDDMSKIGWKEKYALKTRAG